MPEEDTTPLGDHLQYAGRPGPIRAARPVLHGVLEGEYGSGTVCVSLVGPSPVHCDAVCGPITSLSLRSFRLVGQGARRDNPLKTSTEFSPLPLEGWQTW